MKLQSLLETLNSQLNPNEKCVQSSFWCLPVHTVQVSYKPVLRRKMDILMKMLLISIQKARFKSPLQISEILLVEQLFVQDLLSKMERMQLIERHEEVYQITEKGKKQLESGVYEEDQEVTTLHMLYSSIHESFLSGDLDEVLEYEDFPEPIYRYYKNEEQPSISHEVIINEIRLMDTKEQEDVESDHEDEMQISNIDQIEFEQINDIPCIEIIIYNEKVSVFQCRVWNTLLNKWDKEIESQITQYEGSSWKEILLEEK